MAEIVTGAWTPIGVEGFEYYWDPQGEMDMEGCRLAFYWYHPDKAWRARSFVDYDDLGTEQLEWFLQQRTWDLEMSYRARTADYL